MRKKKPSDTNYKINTGKGQLSYCQWLSVSRLFAGFLLTYKYKIPVHVRRVYYDYYNTTGWIGSRRSTFGIVNNVDLYNNAYVF